MIDIQNYEYIEREGEMFAVDRETGEVLKVVQEYIVCGTLAYTPASQRKYKEKQEEEQKRHIPQKTNHPLGQFFFTPLEECFGSLKPETVTRLIYLNTFTRWGDNKLFKSQRVRIKTEDLKDVLKVSKSTSLRFLEEVTPKYVTIDKDGFLLMNEEYFYQGYMDESPKYAHRQKMYVNGIRKLYNAVNIRQHKAIGYLFKMLPFINYEYNVLCYNPEETEMEQIELITVEDFCVLIGCDVAHLNRVTDLYQSIRIEVNGKMERFCSLVYDGQSRLTAKMFVNPHVIYRGGDYTKVEVLGLFCQE